MDTHLLPLFPLEMVLFPGSALPLHIFEDRYRVLIRECLEGKKEFGVNLLLEGKLSPIGCTASVSTVIRTYADGRLDVIADGGRRYALTGYDSDRAPYLVGEVEYLPESDKPSEEQLGKETVRLYNQLAATVYGETLPPVEYRNNDPLLSFTIARKAGMDLQERQRLLEISTEQERMQTLRDYFIEVIPKLKKLGEVERVIRSDGYL
jgi:Lon protease-like protein